MPSRRERVLQICEPYAGSSTLKCLRLGQEVALWPAEHNEHTAAWTHGHSTPQQMPPKMHKPAGQSLWAFLFNISFLYCSHCSTSNCSRGSFSSVLSPILIQTAGYACTKLTNLGETFLQNDSALVTPMELGTYTLRHAFHPPIARFLPLNWTHFMEDRYPQMLEFVDF